MDASQITRKNLEIVKLFVEPATRFANGILLSGSNAWGANYAVKIRSDVDILIVTEGVDELEDIVKCYLAKGLLDKSEQRRFGAFKTLYEKERAEQFSVITDCVGTPVSLDFFDIHTLEKISSLAPMNVSTHQGVDVRTISEFRSNPPRSAGYSVDGLTDLSKITYHPKFEEIKNNQGYVVGYLAETLVDGRRNDRDETAYFIGVMSFFLAISPVIMFDKNGRIKKAVRTLQSNIAKIMNGRIPAYITRQERMNEETLRKVRFDLTA